MHIAKIAASVTSSLAQILKDNKESKRTVCTKRTMRPVTIYPI